MVTVVMVDRAVSALTVFVRVRNGHSKICLRLATSVLFQCDRERRVEVRDAHRMIHVVVTSTSKLAGCA